jgi:flagellar assembly protein FliH
LTAIHIMPAAGNSPALWQMPELAHGSQPPPMPVLPTAEPTVDGADHAAVDRATPSSGSAPDERSTAEELQEARANGYAEGWEQGLRDGTEKGRVDAIAAAEAARTALRLEAHRLAAIAARLGAPISALDAAVEEAVAALALEVARCVIGSEVARSRDYLVRLIREALTKVPIELGAVKIIVHPDDRDLICRLAPDIADGNAELVVDESVEPGDCRVIADGDAAPAKDLRWRPRATEGTARANLSLASRWRAAMRALFEDEDK